MKCGQVWSLRALEGNKAPAEDDQAKFRVLGSESCWFRGLRELRDGGGAKILLASNARGLEAEG